jgi:hypothetical protein
MLPHHSVSKHEKLILVVRDQSGSMSQYSKQLDEACDKIWNEFNTLDCKSIVHFIAFGHYGCIGDASSIHLLKHVSGGTCISQAFERSIQVSKKIREQHQISFVDLIFISDGRDNNMEQCTLELERLSDMPCPCRLLCVGFKGFPINIASGPLFRKFGTRNNVCEPLVLMCEHVDFVENVFVDVCSMIAEPDESQVPSMEDLENAFGVLDFLDLAQKSYNACIALSQYQKTRSEIEAFSACRLYLASVRSCISSLIREIKSNNPSLMISEEFKTWNWKSPLQHALYACTVIEAMQQAIRNCLDEAYKQHFVSDFDEEAKLEILSLAANFGRAAARGLCYHKLDVERIKRSLIGFLEDYPEDVLDSPLDSAMRSNCEQHLSMFDACLGAKSVLQNIKSPNFGLQDLVSQLPQFGIPVCLAALSKKNCWFVHVLDIDLRGLETVQNFLARPASASDLETACTGLEAAYFSCEDSSMERPPVPCPINISVSRSSCLCCSNCLILVPSEFAGSDPLYLRFTATALMYPGRALYFHDALKSQYAATAVHLLEFIGSDWSCPPLGPVKDTLTIIFESYRRAYPRDYVFEAYCKRMADDLNFRECFVLESPHLHPEMSCPHLTKPMFAMWLRVAQGFPWTAKELHARLRGFLIEFFHRSGCSLEWERHRYVKPFHEMVKPRLPRDIMENPLALGYTRLQAMGKALPLLMQPFRGHTFSPEIICEKPRLNRKRIADAKYFQFTSQGILDMFRGLALMSGVEQEFSHTHLTDMDLARLLQVAQISNSMRRNKEVFFLSPLAEVKH